MTAILPHIQRARIAYLTMEIGLRAEVHTYSGGLGILAGDIARSAADLGLPMVFVTLASRDGYLRQELDKTGKQVDNADPWNPADWATLLDAQVALTLDGRTVWVQAWHYELTSLQGTAVPILMLDTDHAGNAAADRTITNRLYGGDSILRLKQEAILGIGGDKMLNALGFRIDTYHLNEGHAAFLPASVLMRHPVSAARPATDPMRYDAEAVRRRCVFTTHTPVEAGHDRFEFTDVERVLGAHLDVAALKLLSPGDKLNMTHLALNMSTWVNGVAKKHGEVAQGLYPGYRVRSITNGVHVGEWAHPAMRPLFDQLVPGWRQEPELLARADRFSDADLWGAHMQAKQALVAEIAARTGQTFDPEKPILAFARRMTGYKRPDLLFSDPKRLKAIAAKYPFQVVMAGKAHPRDGDGKAGIAAIGKSSKALKDIVPVAFVPGYDMALAAHLVGGADVWLNNPLPPLEASGTSGMKAALNGLLNFSVLDGWWIEGWEEGVTGWAIDDLAPVGAAGPGADGFLPMAGREGPQAHAALLYDKLEATVLPLYHDNRAGWLWMMKKAISRVGPVFNSHHMVRRYASQAYLR